MSWTNFAAPSDGAVVFRAILYAYWIAGAVRVGCSHHITDGRADASADQYVRADTLGDLRADHGHLRADVDADLSVTTKAPTPHHHYRQHRTD